MKVTFPARKKKPSKKWKKSITIQERKTKQPELMWLSPLKKV